MGRGHVAQRDCHVAKRIRLAGRDRLGRQLSAQQGVSGVIDQRPRSDGDRTGFAAKPGDLEGGFEGLVGGENAFGQTGERDDRPAEAAEVRRPDIGLGLAEGVDHPDRRRALPGKILQVEQLEPAHAGRAQGGFDFLLVAKRLEFARSMNEVVELIRQMMRGQ